MRFSVVVPIYNKEENIERCFRSILGQTFQDFEVIAVDDGSTDGSMRAVQSLDDSRIRIVQTEPPGRRGPGAARNAGIKAAMGEWIAFLDADDSWADDHLESIAAAAQSCKDLDFIYTGYQILGDGGPTKVIAQRKAVMDRAAFLATWAGQRACPVWTGATAIRRTVFGRSGPFNEAFRRGEDKDLWLRAAMKSRRIMALDGLTAVYFRDSVNKVSKETAFNFAPCLVDAIAGFIKTEDVKLRSTLEAVQNVEIEYYLKSAARGRQSYFDFSRHYYVLRNPLSFLRLFGRYAVPWRVRTWIDAARPRRAPGKGLSA